MQIHFYQQWDEPSSQKAQSASNFASRTQSLNLHIVFIIASIITICFFSYLIFSNHREPTSFNGTGVPKTGELFYTVQSGDTLWSIASQHYPELSVQEAIQAIQNRNGFQGAAIHAGQTILLP